MFKQSKWLHRLGLAAAFTLFLVVSIGRIDPDFGWHLRSGQDVLRQGFIRYEPYTYTATDFDWINHEWLHDAVLAAGYDLGGYAFLALLFAAAWTVALMLASRRLNGWLVAVAAACLLPYAGVRAMVWSLLGLALLERLLERRYYPWLPALFIAWANLHGSFALGLAVIGLAWLKNREARLVAWGLLAALATLLNPYGIKVYIEILRTLLDRDLGARITEWLPLGAEPGPLLYLVLAGTLLMLAEPRKRRLLLSLPTLLLAMTLASQRHFGLFVIASLRYLETYARVVWQQWLPLKQLAGRLGLVLFIATPLAVAGYVAAQQLPMMPREQRYPALAVAYLKQHPCPGNLFNHYDYGGYLIWRLSEAKVYIDGRMPSWRDHNGASYMERYLKIENDQSVQEAEFKKYNIRCAILPAVGYKDLKTHLKAQDWQVPVSTEHYELLIK